MNTEGQTNIMWDRYVEHFGHIPSYEHSMYLTCMSWEQVLQCIHDDEVCFIEEQILEYKDNPSEVERLTRMLEEIQKD